MNIKHHLDEATLLSYTAGSMSQAMALTVACHLSICLHCRERAQESEAIGGMLLDQLSAAPIGQTALDDVLSRLDDKAEIEIMPVKTKTVHNSEVPVPLNEYLDEGLDAIDWKRIVPGVYYHDLPFKSEQGGVSRLLRIAPGKSMLPHSHNGNELTLILRGCFSDEIGRFTPGDIADLDSDIEHQPIVDGNEDCICLVATDAPLKFSTLFGKMVQPLTGF